MNLLQSTRHRLDDALTEVENVKRLLENSRRQQQKDKEQIERLLFEEKRWKQVVRHLKFLFSQLGQRAFQQLVMPVLGGQREENLGRLPKVRLRGKNYATAAQPGGAAVSERLSPRRDRAATVVPKFLRQFIAHSLIFFVVMAHVPSIRGVL